MAGAVVRESYHSPDYLRREYQRLWPRVWQSVCREEELVETGDYITYEIGDESIIVMRSTSGELRACRKRR
jgi:phenylpropionate dioxygenase-like ring-hydroxylating dioxygenase large terminal subunit